MRKMDPLNSNLDCNETMNQFGVESTSFGVEMNVKNSHTLTTTTTGSKNSQKEANHQTSNQNSDLCPPKGPILTDSWSWMKSSARHTLSNQQAQPKEAEPVNLIENDAKSLSKAPCLVVLNMYLTLH